MESVCAPGHGENACGWSCCMFGGLCFKDSSCASFCSSFFPSIFSLTASAYIFTPTGCAGHLQGVLSQTAGALFAWSVFTLEIAGLVFGHGTPPKAILLDLALFTFTTTPTPFCSGENCFLVMSSLSVLVWEPESWQSCTVRSLGDLHAAFSTCVALEVLFRGSNNWVPTIFAWSLPFSSWLEVSIWCF